jgi:hypothetical protein
MRLSQLLHRLAAVLTAASCSIAPLAVQAQISHVEIVEFGIYTARVVRREEAPGTAAGKSQLLADIVLRESTDRVPLALGTYFGMRYVVRGNPEGAQVKLTRVTRFPPPGLTNPATGRTVAVERTERQPVIGRRAYAGFSFDVEWELVPGTWTFELWDGERKLAEKSFQVFRP